MGEVVSAAVDSGLGAGPPPPPPPKPRPQVTAYSAPPPTAPPVAPPVAQETRMAEPAMPPLPSMNKAGSVRCGTMMPTTTAAKPPVPSSGSRRFSALPASSPRGGGVFDRTKLMSDDEIKELKGLFSSFDLDSSGSISVAELGDAMSKLGMPLEQSKLRAMVGEVDSDQSGEIEFEEFVKVVERAKTTKGMGEDGMRFGEVIQKQKATVMQIKKDAIVHSFAEEECAAFADFINNKLASDPQLAYLLPIAEITDLFSAVGDGVLLCRLINVAEAESIDERVINLNPRNPFHIAENHNLALNAAKAIGLTVVNIGSEDLSEGRPHLVLGLLWQMVKMALLAHINLKDNPNLIRLLMDGESLEAFLKLPPEKILLRWFNYHLKEAGSAKRIFNFGKDLADGEAYAILLKQIDPEKLANTSILSNPDLLQRAQYVADNGQRMGAEFHIQARDIVKANEKLNLGFCAALFNACPGLDPPDEADLSLLAELPDDDGGDSREERAFRMWINSLNIEQYVNNLFDDVRDGMVILQTMDKVNAGVVDWSRVNPSPTMVFKRTENLNYAVDLAKEPFKFSLVGVQGKDIVDGNKKLTLALCWQLMRYNLLSFLASLRSAGAGGKELSDTDIIKWANETVRGAGGSSSCRDLHDKSISNGRFLIELLAAVEPRCVDHSLVTAGATEEEQKLNAKYAISSARKLGCTVFMLWEDIVEVRPKMVLSFLATVMAFSYRTK